MIGMEVGQKELENFSAKLMKSNMEKEYAPLLSQQDIIGIANFTTYCKLNIDNATTRPFDLKTIWDNNYKNLKAANIIKEYSRKKYGRKKKYVDIEIEARLWIMNED